MQKQLKWSVVCFVILLSGRVSADAIITSQAMFASTIAEFFVQPGEVRVELEIGLRDLPAFRNLMPDEIYQKMGNPSRDYGERLQEFFSRDLVISTDAKAMAGRLLEIGPKVRVRRDAVTGEEIPVEGAEQETVVVAHLSYAFEGQPGSIVIAPPRANPIPNIGFVLYHNAVAVNDFRYLGQPVHVELDWEDPWYSAFALRSMRRSYFAPMSGFLYIEPFEVRKEIIVRPKDMQRWVDLGLDNVDVIAADQRGVVLEKIADFLSARQPVSIDGESVEPILDRANFLSRTLKSSMVVEEGVDVDLNSAVVGVIFAYPVAALPDRATMTWDMFDDRVQQVPAASVDEAGPFKALLDPEWAVLEWENFLRNPTIPGVIELPAPPSVMAQWLYRLRWWALGVAVLALVVWARRQNRSVALMAASALGLVGLSFVWGRSLTAVPAATEQVVGDLLRNVYQAFDYREESAIYDTLSISVEGDLLTDIYLETQRSLQLANQGGARAKVKSVELQNFELLPESVLRGFRADVTWNVNGSVGHWGHVHNRSNQYQAELELRVIDGRWKLTDMEILQEQRL